MKDVPHAVLSVAWELPRAVDKLLGDLTLQLIHLPAPEPCLFEEQVHIPYVCTSSFGFFQEPTSLVGVHWPHSQRNWGR